MSKILIMTAHTDPDPAPLKYAARPWDSRPAVRSWSAEHLTNPTYPVILTAHHDLYAARLFSHPARTIIPRARHITGLTNTQITVEQRVPGGLTRVQTDLPVVVGLLPADQPQPLPLTTPPPPQPRSRPVSWQSMDEIAAYLRQQTAPAPTTPDAHPPLAEAAVIVAAGKGLGFAHLPQAPASIPGRIQHALQTLVRPLAQTLGGAAAASRAAIDIAGLDTALQVGQSGRSVAPDIYIAVGISGAAQHIQGIHLSRAIIAVNNDAEAPIFNYADYGLVGDAAKTLAALLTALKSKPGK